MYEHVSHSYLVQAIALWISFLPAFGVVALIAGAQFERLSRRSGGAM
jgi:hypothetical protein